MASEKDIIDRLHTSLPSLTLNDEAATEITRLRLASSAAADEVGRLRKALELIATPNCDIAGHVARDIACKALATDANGAMQHKEKQ